MNLSRIVSLFTLVLTVGIMGSACTKVPYMKKGNTMTSLATGAPSNSCEEKNWLEIYPTSVPFVSSRMTGYHSTRYYTTYDFETQYHTLKGWAIDRKNKPVSIKEVLTLTSNDEIKDYYRKYVTLPSRDLNIIIGLNAAGATIFMLSIMHLNSDGDFNKQLDLSGAGFLTSLGMFLGAIPFYGNYDKIDKIRQRNIHNYLFNKNYIEESVLTTAISSYNTQVRQKCR